MRHGLILASSLLLIGGVAEGAPTVAPTRSFVPPRTLSTSLQQVLAKSVSIVVTTPVAAGESFDWTLGTARTSVTESGVPARFPVDVIRGSAYVVNQIAGPRSCQLSANRSGTVGGADIVVSADCGQPAVAPAVAASRSVSVMLVSDVAPGESFRFVLGSDPATVTAKGIAVAFTNPLASGSSYTVSQTDGPRSCTASSNRSGTIASQDIVVSMDCGRPPGNSLLAGQLHAPVGARVVLQLNGGSDLTLTMPAFAGSADPYNLLPFSFPAPLQDGAAYQVSVKSAPAGQDCSVYKGASGTMPVALGAVRVGCEVRVDLVSRSTDNRTVGSYFESSAPSVGGGSGPIGRTPYGYGEGRFIAFVSSAAKLGGATGAHRQVLWRDRLTGETLLVSSTPEGVEGDGDSFAPSISADGLTVAFESHATNLIGNDRNGVRDVYVWRANNRQAGAVRASTGPGGIEANAESFEPVLSGDGRVVAFSSSADKLTPGVSGTGTTNVYRRDLDSGMNVLVSADIKAKGAGGARPAISEDGGRIAFHSFSDKIVAGDTNGLWDIFVYDHASATRVRVTKTSDGGERNGGTESVSRVVTPSLSGDGRYVAYASTANNIVAGDNNGAQDVFVVDTTTGAVARASVSSTGVEGNADSPVGQGERIAISNDGTWVAFSTQATTLGAPAGNVILHNRVTGETRGASKQQGSSVGVPVLSREGGYVVFGAGTPLDSRYRSNSGLFLSYTGLARSFWWFE
jgi:Tol biopolymer transport system component